MTRLVRTVLVPVPIQLVPWRAFGVILMSVQYQLLAHAQFIPISAVLAVKKSDMYRVNCIG